MTSQRTCFNAVFAITVPADLKVEWKEVTVKPVDAKAGGLNISTDTLLTGATSLAEMSGGFAGRNSKDT